MNYVQHTRAAHERLLAQPEARQQHMALYWVLFFAWNSARFPASLPLDRDEIMAAARIGKRDTLTATLRALEAFGLLAYHPSHSAGNSRVVLADLSREVDPLGCQAEGVGCPSKGSTEPGEVDTLKGQQLTPQRVNLGGEVDTLKGQHSLLSKTPSSVNSVNGAAAPEKKIGEVFAGEGLSEAQVLDNPTPPTGADPPPGAAPQEKVARKRRGVGSQAETIRAAATAQADGVGASPAPRRPAPLPELPFSQSAIAEPAAFAAAFQGTDYELADLRHYHQLVATWRDKKTGHPPHRKDWVATAKRFMLNDAADNRLKLAPGTTPASGASPDAGSAPTAGIPTSGYRSSRWD